MENFKLDNFSILVSQEGDVTELRWLGRSEFRNPSDVLNPYFDEILPQLGGKLAVHFDKLEFMNSSTFPALIHFLKKCDGAGLQTTLFYNSSSEWQEAAFRPIKIIVTKFGNVDFA
ncbi:MAG: hypothetical protein AAF518_23180 [Spirochaetota bacterium]